MNNKTINLPYSITLYNPSINNDEIEILIEEDRYSAPKMLLRIFWGLIIIAGAVLYTLYFTQPINGEITLGAGGENPININTNGSLQEVLATVHDNLIMILIMLSVFLFMIYLLLLWAHWNFNSAYNYFFNNYRAIQKYISVNKSLYLNHYKAIQRNPPLNKIRENISHTRLDFQPAAVGSIAALALDADDNTTTLYFVVFYYPDYAQNDNHYLKIFQTKDAAERLVSELSRFFSIPVLAPRIIDIRPSNHSSR